MTFIYTWSAGIVAATIVLALLWRGVLLVRGIRPPRPFWKVLLWHALSFAFHAVVTVPLTLGWFGTHIVGTRPDERGYAGPRIDAQGQWIHQSRESLRADAAAGAATRPAAVGNGGVETVSLTATDGVALRAFHVPPPSRPPAFSVVLVHGLFRGGLELEPPAIMFRDLGGDVLMLEMRNHGASGKAAPTFGRNEARDVLSAVAWFRNRPESANRKLVLFGVSLGSVAVALAAPDVPDLAGIVLDAPADELLQVAHRMLGRDPRPGQRTFAMKQPFRSVTIASVEFWSGVHLAEIRPLDAIPRLSPSTAALIIGGGSDVRMPPDVVRSVFDAVPAPAARKELWIRDGSDHGVVWVDDPAGYRERLQRLVERL